MKKTLIALFIASTFAVSAQTVSKRDKKFVECSAAHGMLEVKLSQLAETKATTPEVKELGKTLAQQRTNSNSALTAIAAKNNIMLPSGLSKKQQKCYDKLAKEDTKKFEKCYTHSMKKCHKKEICHFKKEAKKTDNADLKKFATEAIPTLEQHKEAAKKACMAIKK